MVSLHSATVLPSSAPDAAATVLFLHGILGSGANLRALATRYVAAHPGISATLVDLRGMGRSPSPAGPHSVRACAEDLCALEAELALPVCGVLGHSFGGKVALAYHALRPALERVHILDSAPFPRAPGGSEQTLRVLEMLRAAPEEFDSREAFHAFVLRHGHGKPVAEWLAMNLTRSPGGVRFRPELGLISALIDDYFRCDVWDVMVTSPAPIDVVIGGRSYVWLPEDIARLRALEQASDGRVRGVLLPEAGHWVHVDDLSGTLAAISRG